MIVLLHPTELTRWEPIRAQLAADGITTTTRELAPNAPWSAQLSQADLLVVGGTASSAQLQDVRSHLAAARAPIVLLGAVGDAARVLEGGADLWVDTAWDPRLSAAAIRALVRRVQWGGLPQLDPSSALILQPQLLRLLDDEYDRATRYRRSLAIVVVGITNADESLLSKLGRSIATAIRDVDRLARLAGPRFAVLMPETDVTGALIAGRRLLVSLATTKGAAITMGVAAYPTRGIESGRELLSRGLEAMSQAARSSEGGAVAYGASDVVWSRLALDLDAL